MLTLDDLTNTLLAQFPGKVRGVSGPAGAPSGVNFDPSATPSDKTAINAFVAAYDWNGPNPNPNPDGFSDAVTDAVIAGQLPPGAVQFFGQIIRLYQPAQAVRRKALWAQIKGQLTAGQQTRIENVANNNNMPLV